MINFATYKRFGLVHRPEGLERNEKEYAGKGEYTTLLFHPHMGSNPMCSLLQLRN